MQHDAQLVPIDSLKPYPGNARTHDLDLIRESLRVNGQYRPVVVRTKTRHVLAGNGTMAAAEAEGMTEIWATFVNVDAKAARRINVVDNRANDQAGWDEQLLAAQLGALPDLEGTGWSERELVSFMARVNGPGEDTQPGEPPKKPRTKLGDLWLLGEHRLLCGDATADAERLTGGETPDLLVTDPPYGIDIVKRGTAGNFPGTSAPRHAARPIQGDSRPFDPGHLLDVATHAVLWGANHYASRLPDASRWLVWDKKNGAFEGSALGDCELAWTDLGGAARLLHHTWQGMYRAGEGERSARLHPTQKPVALMAWCIDQAGMPQTVLDPYAGSGTTLIACENLSRRCYAMEIDPGYCDVIIDRWERHTGKKAKRASDASDT